MHPTYLDSNVRTQIARAYKANTLPSVQLQGFLTPELYAQLQKEITKARFTESICADMYWQHTAAAPKTAAFFSSKPFKDFVRAVTGKAISGKVSLIKFSKGNYTLRNDEQKPPGLVVYFDCTAQWTPGWGGSFIVASEYGELARVQPLPNALVLVDCSKAWPFYQYINHYAKKDRVLLAIS